MSESDEERPSCRCLRTHCLQLHCLCFGASYFCSENCKCHDCRNSEYRRTYVEEHFELARKKNPNALAFKVPIVEEATPTPAPVQEAKQLFSRSSCAVPGDGGRSHVKGCRCREIKCSNMSCGCFKSKVGCTYKCKCEGCANSCGIKLSDSVSKTEIDGKKIIKLEQANISGIKHEQTDTSGITSELTKMEKHARSEDDSSSYPSKCPRIWPATKNDTSPP